MWSAPAELGVSLVDRAYFPALLFRARQLLKQGGDRQRVIVRTRPGARGELRHRLESRGKHVRTVHAGIEALTVTLAPSEIEALALDSSVESISIDADVVSDAKKSTDSGSTSRPTTSTSTSTSTSTYTTLPDSLRQALALGDYVLGSNVGVAVLDSGLADNGDFTGRIVGFYDFTASNG